MSTLRSTVPTTVNLERRLAPRTTITGHAYINIEPNNGAMVLNVSDGGLCFHSFDPVPKSGQLRMWFAGRHQRIEVQASLVWTDETHKGGVKFTFVPPEAREHIRAWISQSAGSAAVPVVPAAKKPAAYATTPSNGKQEQKIAAEAKVADIPAPAAAAVANIPSAGTVESANRSPRAVETERSRNGFSRGLITGLLLSAVVVAVFSFQYHRREIGESLINLGEKFASKPNVESPSPTVAAAPGTTAPTQRVEVASAPAPQMTQVETLPAAVKGAATAPSTGEKSAKVEKDRKQTSEPAVPPTASRPAPAQVAKVEPPRPEPKVESSISPSASSVKSSIPVSSQPSASNVPVTSAPNAPPPPKLVSAAKPAIEAKAEPARQPEVQTETSANPNSVSTAQMYFDIGKFKNQARANSEIGRLSQLGFPATTVQKGFLWSNSYHVLVGPYSDEDVARSTHRDLVTEGFKPRPFEKGSRPFALGSMVTINGVRTAPGNYIVSWESSLSDANVKLLRDEETVASASARWVKHDAKFPRDAYVYRRNGDGSRTLIEMRFGGTYQSLAFGKY